MSFEETIRQIIREEIRAAFKELSVTNHDTRDYSQYPASLKVEDVAEIMRIGLNSAYELTRRPGFPAIRDGWKIRIPRDAFFRWYEQEALRNTGEAASR
ncbi:helix-turn-helix domain-containing protein [Effusibacillus pohliae]|uniref:helix-turn-helix domain-containing protein n=1 Tax=Effusibacillus pohliae TaxID=232270 RepID=UPI00037E95D3|nr:helix-turn-helix domain-containing protein [Effusibacillus pohliae]